METDGLIFLNEDVLIFLNEDVFIKFAEFYRQKIDMKKIKEGEEAQTR